jgi:hypothetical protein
MFGLAAGKRSLRGDHLLSELVVTSSAGCSLGLRGSKSCLSCSQLCSELLNTRVLSVTFRLGCLELVAGGF